MPQNRISILIIDDELPARNMIKGFLRGNQIYSAAADFSEGARAMEWLGENKADIVICDMNMPNMDGIEFIRMAKLLYPDIRFIAVSGYSDFHYVRECMVNGVEDYLLKHNLTAELLINTLDTIRVKYNISPTDSGVLPGHILEKSGDFSAAHIRALVQERAMHFNVSFVWPLVFSPDYNPESYPNYLVFKNSVINVIPDIIAQVIDNRYPYLVHITGKGQIAALISFGDNKNTASLMTIVRSVCTKIKDRIGRLMNITLSTGSGTKCGVIEDALEQCRYLQSVNENKLYREPGHFFTAGIKQDDENGDYVLPPYISEQLNVVMHTEDYTAVKKIIHSIFQEMIRTRCSKAGVIKICSGIIQDTDDAKGQNFNDYEFIGDFEKQMLRYMDERINAVHKEQSAQYSITVARAISYIEEQYQRDVSLEECAETVGISYTHLSHIFKKETRCHFSEYLNRIRIVKAKLLLAEKKYPIKEIVELAGFRNYNYFFKVFKDMEGVTPGEYTEFANDGRQ